MFGIVCGRNQGCLYGLCEFGVGIVANELSFGLGGGDGDVVNAIGTTRQR